MDEYPKITVGIEREGLRVTPQGKLATTPHPAVYGDKLDNPYITVDYAEQQIEIITKPVAGVGSSYNQALALARIVQLQCLEDGELFWPASVPPETVFDDQIEIASYRDDEAGRNARMYREDLAQRYGSKKQLFSGVHYNVSIEGADDETYLRIARNFVRYGWFLVYAWGAAPNPVRAHSISMRQGAGGYHNIEELLPDYSSVEAYARSLEQFIVDGVLLDSKEFYAPIRLKSTNSDQSPESLREHGIRYLEIRILDIDPFDEAGISQEALEFLGTFVRFLAHTDDFECDKRAQREGMNNMRMVADCGLNPKAMLHIGGLQVPLLEQVARMSEKLGLPDNVEPLAKRVRDAIDREGFQNAMLALARQHQQQAYDTRWLLPGFEDWELSTQILMKEAAKRGLLVEPFDKEDNLIRITRDWAGLPRRTEYVMQATRTSADSYITPLLMNNKTVTKRILEERGIATPPGDEFSRGEMREALARWSGVPAVIKPKSTNFGIGITMFPEGATLQQLIEATEGAFAHDERVLVETYVAGIEYRFLVISGEVLGVLHRKPANIVGDGVSTIEELVAHKNEHPYRSEGYRTPLIAIDINEVVREFIGRAGYTPQSIPAKDECILLRPNSNISTGGDSIDVTDEVALRFKEIAVEAAHAFDASFCGVDLIIEDVADPSSPYSIIEVNWNPAIHIHSFPAEGVERAIAPAVLRAIGLI